MPGEDAGLLCNSDPALAIPLLYQQAFWATLFSNEDCTEECFRSLIYATLQFHWGKKNQAKNLYFDKQRVVILQAIISSSISAPKHKQHLTLKYTNLRNLRALGTHIPHGIAIFKSGSNSNFQFKIWAVSLLIQNTSVAWYEPLPKKTLKKHCLEYHYKYSQKYFHQHKRLKISLRLQFP